MGYSEDKINQIIGYISDCKCSNVELDEISKRLVLLHEESDESLQLEYDTYKLFVSDYTSKMIDTKKLLEGRGLKVE